MKLGNLVYNLSQVESIEELNLNSYIAGQLSCNRIKDFINMMSPQNIYEMEEIFDIVFNMIECSKDNLTEDMAKEILICVFRRLETLEKTLCPEFSDKSFNFESVSINDSIIAIAQSYIRFVESIYMSFNNYLKEMSKSYYLIKKEILRKSINSMEDLCLIC